MLIKKSTFSSIKLIGILTIISIIILFMFEIQAYYFPTGYLDNKSLLDKLYANPNLKDKEDYINIYKDKEFKDIFEYLEHEDTGYENKFMNIDDSLGCYDNDMMMQDISGVGSTCKTEQKKNFNIFESKLLHPNGNKYTYAEVCPVSSGQERPIMCLYKQGSHINKINNKMANLIDQIQLDQGNRIGHVESSMNTHISDTNRLYNTSPIQEYNKYENILDMGEERRFNNNDQLDDLVQYSNRLKFNLN